MLNHSWWDLGCHCGHCALGKLNLLSWVCLTYDCEDCVDFLICDCVDYQICGCEDFPICGCEDCQICDSEDFLTCGFVDCQICGYVDCQIYGCEDFLTCYFVDYQIYDCVDCLQKKPMYYCIQIKIDFNSLPYVNFLLYHCLKNVLHVLPNLC